MKMNTVDPARVAHEDPTETAAVRIVEKRVPPPLDFLAGAAGLVDPIIAGFNTSRHVWGPLLMDYAPTDGLPRNASPGQFARHREAGSSCVCRLPYGIGRCS